MGYNFSIKNGFRVKKSGVYPWPRKSEPGRTMELFTSDVLTRNGKGGWMKHTGFGTFGHVIPEDDVGPIGEEVTLRLL